MAPDVKLVTVVPWREVGPAEMVSPFDPVINAPTVIDLSNVADAFVRVR